MVNKIYIYDNRTNINFLQEYIKKASAYGFEMIILKGDNLECDTRFNQFKKLYKHYSYNSVDFDINCFARYFAMANLHNGSDTFILSDSDVYVTNLLKNFKDDALFKNYFVGSEGYYKGGSERQISPHFSIWNLNLVNNFIEYVLDVYKRNEEKDFLKELYDEQKSKLGNTGISDMTLLYMWVTERNIPFINTNTKESELGIDHNISSIYYDKGKYKSELNRKFLKVNKTGEVQFVLESNNIQNMAVVHFQGRYKKILYSFYKLDFLKFKLFTYYILVARFVKKVLKK